MDSDVINVLREIDHSLAPATASQTQLGEVKDFASLVQRAQREGVPLADFSGQDYRKEEAQQAFDTIAKAIIRMAKAGRSARMKKKSARKS